VLHKLLADYIIAVILISDQGTSLATLFVILLSPSAVILLLTGERIYGRGRHENKEPGYPPAQRNAVYDISMNKRKNIDHHRSFFDYGLYPYGYC